jgi:L-asparaginase
MTGRPSRLSPGYRAGGSPSLLAVVTLLALLPTGVPGQQAGAGDGEALPRVHVLATGGTISNTEGDRLTGEDLVRSLPGVEEVARLTVEQFTNVASSALSLEAWLGLQRRIDSLFREGDGPAGVVVTHGTDTMEETAWFLELTLSSCRPVVVTGAMRRASDPGADGPANLLGAIRLAALGEARELGAVVLMNDEIHSAREAVKVHTTRVHAFRSPETGPLGVVDPDGVVLHRARSPRNCGAPDLDLTGVTSLPRVEIVHTHLGADGTLLRAAVAAGAQGIVLAGVGRGNITPDQGEAVREAREAGVTVVVGSRTGAGRVPVRRGPLPPSGDGLSGALLGAGDLTPQKARILLMLALTRTRDPGELEALFAEP